MSPSSTAPSRTPLWLVILSLLAIALSLYQWVELVAMRTQGIAPACSLNAKVDCAAIWNSPLAEALHDYSGIPFSGWGMAWGLVILSLALQWIRRTKQQNSAEILLALRLTTGIGILVCIALLAYSAMLGTFCPTCLLFYVLVGLAAYVAWRHAYATASWPHAILRSAGPLVIVLAALLYPGLHTPKQDISVTALAPSPDHEQIAQNGEGNDAVARFLRSLSPEAQQTVSDVRALYQAAPLISQPVDGNRLIYGSTRASVHLIDWIDIRCPHCKHLEEALNEIRKITPNDSWSEEARHFPLDNECNPQVTRSSGGISCLAAKVLICLAGSPKGNVVRDTLFNDQAELSKDKIWEIAAQTPAQRASLEQCVNSTQTAATLQEDIDYAVKYHVDGTPLLVINGRRALAFPPFILAMIIAGGNANDPGFQMLPSPRPEDLSQ